MATGYNAKSRNELAIQYVEYVTNGGGMEKEDEEYIRDCSDARILDLIESNGFTIEWSKEPFEDIEECNQ